MNILVTGAKGFIGKHMCILLKRRGHNVLEFDITNTNEDLEKFMKDADFVVHLAGINRPKDNETYDANASFTDYLLSLNTRNIPMVFSSSIQAALDNEYGRSKKLAEDYLLASKATCYIYRFANVFGKWCRPNYNSAAATFCYNIAHGLDIQIRDREYVVHYNYIDDIVNEICDLVEGKIVRNCRDINYIQPTYDCSLGHLADLLYYFKNEVESDRHLPLIHDEFELKLFKTFLDYLADEGLTYNFASDERGSFEELYKSKKFGQISENVSYPGITKGGHYHTYKKEIFYVVDGSCRIRQRNINTNEMLDVVETSPNAKPVDVLVNYTHEITNVGERNSKTLMWISEVYNPETHDTFREDVNNIK